jgi:lipoate-protein ligase B
MAAAAKYKHLHAIGDDGNRARATVWAVDLGRRRYGPVLALQHAIRDAIFTGSWPETVLFVEHDPVITLGRRARRENLRVSNDFLAQQGVELIDVERGGDVTYHGPGQLVCYPIFRVGRRVRAHVRGLADAVTHTCAEYGVDVVWDAQHPGLWVGREKIAAIGVRVHRGVTTHGLALNVGGALAGFGLIVPCGLHDRTITSLEKQCGKKPPWPELVYRLAGHLARDCDRQPFTFLPSYEIFSYFGLDALPAAPPHCRHNNP